MSKPDVLTVLSQHVAPACGQAEGSSFQIWNQVQERALRSGATYLFLVEVTSLIV